MKVFVWLMAAIGFFVVGYFVLGILSEGVRAAKQGHRIATAHARYDKPEPTRKPTFREWWFFARHDFLNYYADTIVGPVALSYDPKTPARRYR